MNELDMKNIWIGVVILIAILLTIAFYTWSMSTVLQCIFFIIGAGWAYIIPAALVTVMVRYFTKVRHPWTVHDKLTLVVPFIVWVICFFGWPSNKSLSNLGIEPFFLGCSMILSPIVKHLLGSRIDEKRLSLFTIFLLSFMGISIWLWMPSLPE